MKRLGQARSPRLDDEKTRTGEAVPEAVAPAPRPSPVIGSCGKNEDTRSRAAPVTAGGPRHHRHDPPRCRRRVSGLNPPPLQALTQGGDCRHLRPHRAGSRWWTKVERKANGSQWRRRWLREDKRKMSMIRQWLPLRASPTVDLRTRRIGVAPFKGFLAFRGSRALRASWRSVALGHSRLLGVPWLYGFRAS